MIADISYRSNSTITPPSGWQLAAGPELSGNTTVNGTGSIASGRMDYIIRGSGSPSLTWTRTGGDLEIGRIRVYRSVGGLPISLDVSSSNTLATANTAVTAGGLTASKGKSLMVVAACGARNSTWSALTCDTNPAGASGATDATAGELVELDTFSERADSGSTSGADGSLAVFDAVKSTAGATGTLRATASSSARHVFLYAIFKAGAKGAPFRRRSTRFFQRRF